MFKIKKDFNEVVRENTNFVMAIVRKFVRNPEIVKDLTQEIFIKAYLNYDYYTETGKIKSWLSVIANNKLKNYYKAEHYRNERIEFLSFDDFTPVISISTSKEETPENIAEQKDFTEQVVKIINTLPQKQRDAVLYSVVYNYSENEIAKMQNIPVGSVKSAKHYGLEKVKKLMIENNLINGKVKNMNKLNKQEAYALLFQYAKNQISDEDKAAVEEYMKTDEESKSIMEALRELYPKLTFDDYITGHYGINFVLDNGDMIRYGGMGFSLDKNECERRNAYLEKHDGNTPPEEKWGDHGWNGKGAVASYDNDGNKLEFEQYQREEARDYSRAYIKKMKKIYYPMNWQHGFSYYDKGDNCFKGGYIKKLDIAPNLYEANLYNGFGGAVKSALYIALPENAVNIRVKRGNGVIKLGKYKFLYVDRYLAEDEAIIAECTFNM